MKGNSFTNISVLRLDDDSLFGHMDLSPLKKFIDGSGIFLGTNPTLTGVTNPNVSNTLGNYQIINTNAPLVNSNHGSLTIVNEDEIYLTYDMDGRIFIVEINLETATLKNEPLELLGPKTLKENFKYLDAPQITKINDTYHILFSQFYGGYIINVYHMTAKHPKGPWIWSENNPVYTFLEADADLEVKNTYPEKHGFAPPTQVVFSNQIFKGLNNQYFNAYHSSEKYSEPYLCIDSVLIDRDKIIIKQNKKSYE
jgi:hypothetical protein